MIGPAADTIRGVVLAGGSGTRLLPLTAHTNKHLLPVGGRPMIHHPIGRLVEAGVTEILVTTGTTDLPALRGALADGAALGAHLTFAGQDRPGGIAQALGLARGFAAGGRIVVILGDNVFDASLRGFVAAFRDQPQGARLLLRPVEDPGRYGVAVVEGGRIARIIEKPAVAPSNLAVVGIYAYDARVFDVIPGLQPSARGELEITDVNNAYAVAGTLAFDELPGFWIDAGTPDALAAADRAMAGAHGAR